MDSMDSEDKLMFFFIVEMISAKYVRFKGAWTLSCSHFEYSYCYFKPIFITHYIPNINV